MNGVNYKNINAHGVGDNKHHSKWCPKYRPDYSKLKEFDAKMTNSVFARLLG